MQALTPQPYPDDATRWQAVLDRDLSAEGVFYYAVTTTGVYCRPTCAARRPRVAHVRFFTTPEAAEAVVAMFDASPEAYDAYMAEQGR